MDNSKNAVKKFIKCPHCGWEYEPGEVMYPNKVFGYPINVIRDALGHIIYTEYRKSKYSDSVEEPDYTEEFYCENCNKPFVIEVDMTFKSKPQDEELDFSDTAVSLF